MDNFCLGHVSMFPSSLLVSFLGLFLVSFYPSLSNSATATFSENGIEGEVTVISGNITIHLDFSNFNENNLPGGSYENCFGSELNEINWYFHANWTHDAYDDMLTYDCDNEYTGYHYDPWLGCSDESNNDYCEDTPGSSSCVPGGSIYWGDAQSYSYCNVGDYSWNPYNCEMGDLTGKYGTLTYNSKKLWISDTHTSAFELDSSHMDGLSIVFACSDGDFAFCAPFQGSSSSKDRSQQRGMQGESPHNSDSKVAYFNKNSSILLMNNGSYLITIDPKSIDGYDFPNDCGDSLKYRIYTQWDEEATGCGTDRVARFYDPTVTCAYDSVNIDKGLCSDEDDEDSQLCWDPNYAYSCDWNGDTWLTDCAPGDLSSKYGEIDITDSKVKVKSGYDDWMVSLNSLKGLSVVLQCADTYETVACAEWIDCDGCSNIKNSSSNNNNNSDSGDTWIIIILILIAMGGIYYYYKKQQAKNAETMGAVVNTNGAGTDIPHPRGPNYTPGHGRHGSTMSHHSNASHYSHRSHGSAYSHHSAGPKPHHGNKSTIAGPSSLRNAQKGPVGGTYGLGADRQVRQPRGGGGGGYPQHNQYPQQYPQQYNQNYGQDNIAPPNMVNGMNMHNPHGSEYGGEYPDPYNNNMNNNDMASEYDGYGANTTTMNVNPNANVNTMGMMTNDMNMNESEYAASIAPSDIASQYNPDNPYNPYNNGPVAAAAAAYNHSDPSMNSKSLYEQKYGNINSHRTASHYGGSKYGGSQYGGSTVGSIGPYAQKPLKYSKKRTQTAMSSGPGA